MIKSMTRGTIEFEFRGRAFHIQGEGHLPGGPVDYVIYSKLITRQDPDDHEPITPDVRQEIVDAIVRELEAKGMKVEVA